MILYILCSIYWMKTETDINNDPPRRAYDMSSYDPRTQPAVVIRGVRWWPGTATETPGCDIPGWR